MKYSDRILKTVLLIEKCDTLCDIGCDHGYMSILAVENQLAKKVYACDVKEGPLSRAVENISAHSLSDRIEPVLSDGFSNVPEKIDCAVICGMGGLLIRKILFDGKEKVKNVKQLVLGPHSEEYELRKYIYSETPFQIRRETCVLDQQKHYVLMDLVNCTGKEKTIPTDEILRYGDPSIQTDPNIYRDYLYSLISKNEHAISKCELGKNERSHLRKEALQKELEMIKRLLNESGD